MKCKECNCEIEKDKRVYTKFKLKGSGKYSCYRRCYDCYYSRKYQQSLEKRGPEELNRIARENKAKRRLNGQCSCCSEKLLSNNNTYCMKHYIMNMVYTHKLEFGYDEFLRKRDDQKGLCYLSGEKLIIGENISIDHLIPKSKGGSNSYENIKLCHVHYNRMKLDHSLDYLYTMCKNYINNYETMNLNNLIKTA